MQEPPDGIPDAEVLAAVRHHWLPCADRVDHLPVGFGAHHWVAYVEALPRLFVTLDRLDGHHDAASLETTYTAAAELGAALVFVVACLPTETGTHTVPFAGAALSCTPWWDGTRPDDPLGAIAAVRALHAAPPPTTILGWTPLVPPSLADDVVARLSRRWDAGPCGEDARAALVEHHRELVTWVTAYHRLADQARARPWVPTHGEPHRRNQLLTAHGLVLVDWESLRLAPAERDLRWLDIPDADWVDPRMVEMFDLEWRLDEIAQYAAHFAGPHLGGPDDRTALDGLRDALA